MITERIAARYTMVINTLYVIAISIVLQSVVKITDKLEVISLIDENNLHLILLLFVMCISRWVLFNSYQETHLLDSRTVYFVDGIQIIIFIGSFYACIKGGTIGVIAFVSYLFLRSIVEVLYANALRRKSNEYLERLSADAQWKLIDIYTNNKDFFKSSFTAQEFIILMTPKMRTDFKKDIGNTIEKMNLQSLWLNMGAGVFGLLCIVLILYFTLLPGLPLFSKPQQADLFYQVSVPLLIVAFAVVMIQGAAHIYTAALHLKLARITRGSHG